MRYLVPVLLIVYSSLVTALPRDVEWKSSFQQGLEEARRDWKPMLIDFWASWCEPCRRMDREVYTDSRFKELAKKFVLIQIDVDRFMATQARYHVEALPTVMFLDPFEMEIARREGFTRAKDLAAIMKAVPPDFSALSEIASQLDGDSKTFGGFFNLAEFYRAHGLPSISNRHYREAIDAADPSVDHKLVELAFGKIGLNDLSAGDKKSAEKVFKQRLEKCPGCPMTPMLLMGLGKTYFEMKKNSRARKVFEELLRDYPDSEYAAAARETLNALK